VLRFKTIDIEKHCDEVVRFRKDSFLVSFGDISDFNEAEYLNWLKDKLIEFPEGFVMVEENGRFIGQLELSIRKYEGRNIGYVHLYYLIPEKRGKGIGQELHNYAINFFRNNKVTEYHLRVSPNNTQAMKFYKKNGMEELGSEFDGKVIRMKGNI
jgi:RimJ/RimL family protein N-acetyltransferase